MDRETLFPSPSFCRRSKKKVGKEEMYLKFVLNYRIIYLFFEYSYC